MKRNISNGIMLHMGVVKYVLHLCDFQGHYRFVQVFMRLLVGFFA